MSNAFPSNVLRYGRDEPLPDEIPLQAGPLELIFSNGDLRAIRIGEREIVQRIYVAVRDPNWGTPPLQLLNLQIEQSPFAFNISFDATHQHGVIDFRWRGTITGAADGTLSFTMDGTAHTTFRRNRLGFCVLHPSQDCAGLPCVVEHPDGTIERGVFPELIAPDQPFLDIQAISYEIGGARAELRFSGDVFEMEDQRNWSDSSYKTYCTPLALPFPVTVAAGTRVMQSITLAMKAQGGSGDPPQRANMAAAVAQTDSSRIQIDARLTGNATPLPAIGLRMASHGQPLVPGEIGRLLALNMSHLRVEMRPARDDVNTLMEQATQQAAALNVPLEIALVLDDDPAVELAAVMQQVARLKPSISRWLLLHVTQPVPDDQTIALARDALVSYDPAAQIGAGSNTNFGELNRNRPRVEALNYLCYALNPQVHAFDNRSLMENLAAQPDTVNSAQQIGGRAICVGPVTLRPRFNPVATEPDAPAHPDDLPTDVDPRQMALFGAAWTLGSLRYLATSGAASLTYYETSGWRGVLETAAGSALPERFRALPGMVFPLYHVLADVGEFKGGTVQPLGSGAPGHCVGMALNTNGRTRMLLANLTAQTERVRLALNMAQWRTKLLDETTVLEAMRTPEEFRANAGEIVHAHENTVELILRPYAVARIDSLHPGDSA